MKVSITVECSAPVKGGRRKHTITVDNVDEPQQHLRGLASSATSGLLGDAIDYVCTGRWPVVSATH